MLVFSEQIHEAVTLDDYLLARDKGFVEVEVESRLSGEQYAAAAFDRVHDQTEGGGILHTWLRKRCDVSPILCSRARTVSSCSGAFGGSWM